MALFSRDLLNLQRNVDSMFNSMRNQYFGSDNLLGGSSFFAPTLMDIDLDLEPSSFFTPSSLLLTSGGGSDAFPSKDHTALQQQAPASSNGGRIQQHNHQPMDLLAGISPNAWNQLSQMHLDVHATPQAYTVTCDLPGVEKSSIDIQADQRTHQLTISAERRSEHTEHEATNTGANGAVPSSNATDTKSSTTSPSGSNSPATSTNSSASTGSNEKTDQQQVAAPQQQAVSTNTRPRIVRQERFYGKTQRSVRLAQDADLERVEAKYENGVLTLTVPRKERQPEPNRFKKVQVL